MARYADAIRWIAENDDCDWLDSNDGIISVTASMVSDLFNKSDEEVIKDLRREVIKQQGKRLRFRLQGDQ